MTTIYFHQAGPMIRHGGGALHVSDLNPEVTIRWRMSRWELVKIAIRCLVAACRW